MAKIYADGYNQCMTVDETAEQMLQIMNQTVDSRTTFLRASLRGVNVYINISKIVWFV